MLSHSAVKSKGKIRVIRVDGVSYLQWLFLLVTALGLSLRRWLGLVLFVLFQLKMVGLRAGDRFCLKHKLTVTFQTVNLS